MHMFNVHFYIYSFYLLSSFQDVAFSHAYNATPNVLVSTNHSTKGGNLSPEHNGITAWIEVRQSWYLLNTNHDKLIVF